MARYHGHRGWIYGYGIHDVDVSFPSHDLATPGAVRATLRRHDGGRYAAVRDEIRALRYGYVNLNEWTTWASAGVALHVLAGGADVTLRVCWFDDALDPETFGAALGRRCELYVVDDQGRKLLFEDPLSGARGPRTESLSDFTVIPTLVVRASAFTPLDDEAIAWWTGDAPDAPRPRRALDLA